MAHLAIPIQVKEQVNHPKLRRPYLGIPPAIPIQVKEQVNHPKLRRPYLGIPPTILNPLRTIL